MVRQLEVRSRCDLCTNGATRTDVLVAIYRAKPKTLDLCEFHFAQLVEPLLKAVKKHGVNVRTGAKPPDVRHGWKRRVGPLLCQAGCVSAPLKYVLTLEVHLRKLHGGMTLEEYIERYGELQPLTPEEVAELEVEVVCDQPGCNQRYSLSRGNRYPQQAMVAHMRGHHGIKWSPGVTKSET